MNKDNFCMSFVIICIVLYIMYEIFDICKTFNITEKMGTFTENFADNEIIPSIEPINVKKSETPETPETPEVSEIPDSSNAYEVKKLLDKVSEINDNNTSNDTSNDTINTLIAYPIETIKSTFKGTNDTEQPISDLTPINKPKKKHVTFKQPKEPEVISKKQQNQDNETAYVPPPLKAVKNKKAALVKKLVTTHAKLRHPTVIKTQCDKGEQGSNNKVPCFCEDEGPYDANDIMPTALVMDDDYYQDNLVQQIQSGASISRNMSPLNIPFMLFE